MSDTTMSSDEELRKKLEYFDYNGSQGIQLTNAHLDYVMAIVAKALHEAEVRAQIKQLRRILQHEIDVYGASRNKSYIKAEIEKLLATLTAEKEKKV